MAQTFGLTGMDPATESTLKAAFNDANALLGNKWEFLPETEAEYVVVDMDSMYGPMSWLRLHAAGKTVIGLTSAPRTQTDYRLAHPFDTTTVANLLMEVAEANGMPVGARPAGISAAPQPQDQLPKERAAVMDEEQAKAPVIDNADAVVTQRNGSREPASAAAGRTVPTAASIEPATPPVAAAPEPEMLGEWLSMGRIKGRTRLERDGTILLIDAAHGRYHGPRLLKPLAAHVSSKVNQEDLVELDEAQWAKEANGTGEPMPISRLVWYGALMTNPGTLAPGFDPTARFQMLKWPQTEREYPKHFRIATVMMKGPTTIADIADTSGVPEPDVIDFINANLATGFADIEHQPEPEPETQKSSGLFGRLRGR